MVKKISLILSIIILTFCLIINSCDQNDLFGLFSSLELDERLKEQNKFVFLNNQTNSSGVSINPFALTLGANYSFVVLTDTHLEDDKTFDLDKLAGIVNGNPAIKFVIITGDITQKGAETEINNFIKFANSVDVPVYPVIGNHDFYFDNWEFWRDKIGSTLYKIDADTATLIILDAGNAFYGKTQLDWLETQLEETKGTVFVFSHSNLFAEGIYNMQQSTSEYERARIVSLLKKNKKRNVMIMGHTHKDQYNKVGTTEYIVLEDYVKARSYYIINVTGSGITRTKQTIN
ncbi:MAG: metallophosphoesterase [Treponema sp.]|jgi:predicted phosphodiesterase|nr:metallophosphoesterase [Treponema sp.]